MVVIIQSLNSQRGRLIAHWMFGVSCRAKVSMLLITHVCSWCNGQGMMVFTNLWLVTATHAWISFGTYGFVLGFLWAFLWDFPMNFLARYRSCASNCFLICSLCFCLALRSFREQSWRGQKRLGDGTTWSLRWGKHHILRICLLT